MKSLISTTIPTSKINFIKEAFELGLEKPRLFLTNLVSKLTLQVANRNKLLYVNYRKKRDYLFLPENFSAKRYVGVRAASSLAFLLVLLLISTALVSIISRVPIFVLISSFISLFYFSILLFKLYVLAHSKRSIRKIKPEEIRNLDPGKLPTYTVLVPLKNEANVAGQTIHSIKKLDYPQEKLQVLITLEKDDRETREALERENLPDNFKIVSLPDVFPKTKPKALNVAFPQVKGKYVVIYDAEIIPDRKQLKKAVISFARNPQIAALQPKLGHYNAGENLLTRLFSSEFAFHYNFFLPGLMRLGFPIPLSGHSVHFKSEALKKIGAWDPYNVTEDCDLGIRLHRLGFRAAMLDSTSREEATSTLISWLKQRTRWMKGFIQTSFVHAGWLNLAFLFIVPGTTIINFLNIVMLFLLIGWFVTNSVFIQDLFPGFILYISVLSFVVGNFIFIYLNLLALYSKKNYSQVKYALLSPFYWILLSVASLNAFIELFIRPYYWDKTKHGVVVGKEKLTTVILSKIRYGLSQISYAKIPFLS